MHSRVESVLKRRESFFFIDGTDASDDELSFSPFESHHMVKSLRVRRGEVVTASDGNGTLYGVEITSTGGPVTGKLLWKKRVEPDRRQIFLGVGLGRTESLSWLVEKATELGVRGITPLVTKRSQKAGTGEMQGRLLARFHRVAVSAMKQSKRAYMPAISRPIPLPDFLRQVTGRDSLLILLDETLPEPTLTAVLRGKAAGSFIILAGPEAGFDEEEKALALGQGFIPASLGTARLRVETAALAAVIAVRALSDSW
jgi:16S rRNA (uracil1498-N3)-methyltransferase